MANDIFPLAFKNFQGFIIAIGKDLMVHQKDGIIGLGKQRFIFFFADAKFNQCVFENATLLLKDLVCPSLIVQSGKNKHNSDQCQYQNNDHKPTCVFLNCSVDFYTVNIYFILEECISDLCFGYSIA